MATFDYRSLATGEIREIIRIPGERAPDTEQIDGQIWERLPAAPRIVTADTRKFREPPSKAWLKKHDKRVVERGHTKDIERARRYKEEAQEKAREESIVASVNRAMP